MIAITKLQVEDVNKELDSIIDQANEKIKASDDIENETTKIKDATDIKNKITEIKEANSIKKGTIKPWGSLWLNVTTILVFYLFLLCY